MRVWPLFLFLLTTSAQAAVYQVSPQGSDGTPCGQGPRRSINGGIACLAGGDTLVIGGGTYDEAIYDWQGAYAGGTTSILPSGISASSPTTLRAAPGEAVWLRPSMVHPGGGGQIELDSSRYIVLDGINVNLGGMTAYIVIAGKGSSHLDFRNMELTNSRHCGVSAYGDALRFSNLHVHHNAFGAAASQNGQSCHGFYVAGSNGVYDRLRVHDHDGYGLQFSCDGCGGAGGGNVVQNSIFYNNKQGGVVAGGANNSVINNLFYHNGTGVIAYGSAIHNTLYAHAGGLLVGGSPEIRDNLVIDTAGGEDIGTHYSGSGGNARNNGCSGQGFGCAIPTPASVFVNAGAADFHVRPGSAASRTATDGKDLGVDFGALATGGSAPPPPQLLAPWNLRVLTQTGGLVLAWDHATPPPGTRYLLRLVTLTNGSPTLVEQVLDVVPAAQCAQWPDAQRARTSLCGRVCLPEGDVTLRLAATWQGERSGETNALDVDVGPAAACQPAKPVQTLPPFPPLPTRPLIAGAATGVVVGGAIAGTAIAAAGHVPAPPSWLSLVNPGCVSYAVEGPCVCGYPPAPCVQVGYWEPAWIVETVKKPGTSVLPGLGSVLTAALSAAGIPALGGGGAGQGGSGGHINLHYSEAHVWRFPQVFGGPCTGCAPGSLPPLLHYASEIDHLAWRQPTGFPVPTPLTVIQQIGSWAPWWPRNGHAIHGSPSVASGVAAARALHIAFQPVGEPPHLDAHVVLTPADNFSTCCQLAYPKMTPCFPFGLSPFLWETGTGSPQGTYAWIIWAKRTCCLPPPPVPCGIAMPPLGGYGQNGCLIPSIPSP